MTARESSKTRSLQDDETEGGNVAPRVEQIGVQSFEVAGHLLKTLATLDGPQTLSALSAAAGLPPAKAHRYLVSLIRGGFIEQSTADGRYDFGGAARLIGRVAMNRLDIVRIGTPLLSNCGMVCGRRLHGGLDPRGADANRVVRNRPADLGCNPPRFYLTTAHLGTPTCLHSLSAAGNGQARYQVGDAPAGSAVAQAGKGQAGRGSSKSAAMVSASFRAT